MIFFSIERDFRNYSGPWRNRTLADRLAGCNLLIKNQIPARLQITAHYCILLQIVAARNLPESLAFANNCILLHISAQNLAQY